MIEYENKWPLNTIGQWDNVEQMFLRGRTAWQQISVKQLQSIRGQSLLKLEDSEYIMSFKAENKSHFEDNFIRLDA